MPEWVKFQSFDPQSRVKMHVGPKRIYKTHSKGATLLTQFQFQGSTLPGYVLSGSKNVILKFAKEKTEKGHIGDDNISNVNFQRNGKDERLIVCLMPLELVPKLNETPSLILKETNQNFWIIEIMVSSESK